MELDEVLERFDYVAPDEWSRPLHDAVTSGHRDAASAIEWLVGATNFRGIADACKDFARVVFEACPAGIERDRALGELELVRMAANFAAGTGVAPPAWAPADYRTAWKGHLLRARMWASGGIAAAQRQRNKEVAGA